MENFQDPRLSSSYWALRITFIVVPVVAGIDKFLNFLTDWTHYLSPAFARIIPMSPQAFMHVVGVVEIVAGLIVASKLTRVGAYIVMAWLICIAINLLSMRVLDVAVRDLAMAVGAFTLARLEEARASARVPARSAATVSAVPTT
jgi:uncharacterized membrane protein YphA (DoxX/SURF4 family)